MTSQQESTREHIERQVMNRLRARIAYAEIDPSLRIAFASPELVELVLVPEANIVGEPVVDVFVELVGLEASMAEILAGRLPELSLNGVNRQEEKWGLRYLNFSLFALDVARPQDGLLLLVEEDTVSGHLQQELVQERNQLRLMQQELAQANANLQRLDQLKTLFLSIAAHDMRTPLGIMGGYVDLLLEELEEAELVTAEPDLVGTWERYLRVMRDQLDWLERLIGNILDLNLIEQGRLVVRMEPFDLRRAVVELRENLVLLLESEHKRLEVSLPAGPVWVAAEPDRLRQVILNLVGNSLKFIGQGGVIELLVSTDGALEQAHLLVRDNGPGIQPAHQTHLFNLFYRTPEVEQVQGTGLGLFIAKMLVEQMGGQIGVESIPREGTTFIITLPLLAAETDPSEDA